MAEKKPEKIRVKLNPLMKKKGQGLCDASSLNPQVIAAFRYDKSGSMEVYATEFVLKQIEAGALIEVDAEKALEDYTKKELEAKAKEDGVDLSGCKTKAEMVAKFVDAPTKDDPVKEYPPQSPLKKGGSTGDGKEAAE